MVRQASSISLRRIERSIVWIRGQSVLLDADLANLYGAETRTLVQAVKRHRSRFPDDFMFRLTKSEYDDMKDLNTATEGRGGRRYEPYAFTEQGVAMLSSVLNSPRAVAVNIEIMRAFVRFRQMITNHQELAQKLDQLERKFDRKFRVVFDAMRALMVQEERPKHQIGFKPRK